MLVGDGLALLGDQGIGGLEVDGRPDGLPLLLPQVVFQALTLADDGLDLRGDLLLVTGPDLPLARLQLIQPLPAAGLDLGDLLILGVLLFLLQRANLVFDALDRPAASLLVDMGHDILRKIQHPVQVAPGDIQQEAQVGGHPAGVPDVRHRRGQGDVAHAFPADRGPRDLHAAFLAGDALEADVLVLAAIALPVLGGPKDGFIEQAILLRPQAPVVDGFRLQDFAVGPAQDRLGRSKAYAQRSKALRFHALSSASLDGEQETDRFLSTTTNGTTSWHSKTSAGGPFASSAVRAGRAGGVYIHVGYIISRRFDLSRLNRRP